MIRFAITALMLVSFAPSPAVASAPASRRDLPLSSFKAAPLDTVVFAGGCFWGVQGVFQHVRGVVRATSGYSGGTVANPGYAQVSTGRTGNAESVRVIYDPAKVSYDTLLEVFFRVAHDPTELDRQGPDVGTQYRSAVFYTSDAQQRTTLQAIARLQKSGAIEGRIATQVQPLRGFYTAESYHQDYVTLHPNEPYVRYNDLPKLAQLKRAYPQLWSARLAAH